MILPQIYVEATSELFKLLFPCFLCFLLGYEGCSMGEDNFKSRETLHDFSIDYVRSLAEVFVTLEEAIKFHENLMQHL
jgi:hypothetical protein